jgi:sugar phosphate isomerase/epimerase
MLGIQLYTVRDKLSDIVSVRETLSSLKAMGYESVQLAGDFEKMDAICAAAKEVGLKVAGLLAGCALLRERMDEVMALAREYSICDVGVSADIDVSPEAHAADMNAIAAAYRREGISFSYHNHSYEYTKKAGEESLADVLRRLLDPSLVDLMPDVYWLQHAGVDVRDYISRNAERIKLVHLKDMKIGDKGPAFTEVGEGNINMEGIIALSKKLGVEHFIVEQDVCEKDSLLSAQISCKNVKRILESIN